MPSRAAFLRYFDAIFTSDVREAIGCGDAVRRGIVRISYDDSTSKIIAINVPIGGRGGTLTRDAALKIEGVRGQEITARVLDPEGAQSMHGA